MESPFRIFLVEDDLWYAEILEYQLSMNPDYEIHKFENGKDCLSNLHTHPGVVCIDFSLPDMNGLELVKAIHQRNANIPVIMISGQEDVRTAIEALKQPNVFDYITKDDETRDKVWKSVINVREKSDLVAEVESLRAEVGSKYNYSNAIKGNSPAITALFKMLDKASGNNITVSITGQTGTGKELAAKCIHYNSARSKNKFVAVNVNAVPSELIESELFGHEKGAFTGAANRRIGKFEEANNGTLFLDEIADMDLSMQAKLLRALQERKIVRVGGNKPIKVNLKVVVATHKDLAEEVKAGRFREDLYFRLLGLPIEMPSMKERKSDILILAKHFVDLFAKENGMAAKKFSDEAAQKLQSHHYPGNVRELKAVVDLAMVLSDEDMISPEDIKFNNTATFTDFVDDDSTLKSYTAKIIRYYLERMDDDVSAVARKLDIGKSTLYRMIKNGEV